MAKAEEADEEEDAVAENAAEEAAEKEAGEECKEADEEEEQEEEEVEVEEEAEAETEAVGEPQTSPAVCVAAPPRPTRSNTAPSTTLLQLGDHTSKGQLASEPSPPRPRPASTALTVTWRAGDRVHARYGARLVAKQYTRWFPGAIR